jgi:hypothetical protein
MDDGVLRIEPSYAAARRWVLNRHLTDRVLRRVKYAAGDYQLFVGDTPEQCSAGDFILREDRLTGPTAGWEPEQSPLYPLVDRPHELVDRQPAHAEGNFADGTRECTSCGDLVSTLSSRNLCDGCEADDRAGSCADAQGS